MKIDEQISRFDLQKIAIIQSKMIRPNHSYEQRGKLSLNLDIGHNFNEHNNLLSVLVAVKAYDNGPENERLEIEITSESIFSISESEEEELNLDFFSKVNAPAIIYPYIRQHVTYLSLQSGVSNPIILPVLNFVKLDKMQNADKE